MQDGPASGAAGKPTLILILLRVDRSRPGHLHLVGDDGGILFSCAALGKASTNRAINERNPHRDPLRPYGDTPTGSWYPTSVQRLPEEARSRLGPEWIPLNDPELGDAVEAVRNGRSGLGIHAGQGDEHLVPTFGCMRLKDRDFAELARRLGRLPVRVLIGEV